MNGNWESIRAIFWECGSYGLIEEELTPQMPSVDRWWRKQSSAYAEAAEGFANILMDFRIRQVRVPRRFAPALMESGLECSISNYIFLTTADRDCKARRK